VPLPICDITGRRFGALVAVRRLGRRGKRSLWLCRCDCGREVEAVLDALACGRRTSCGCRPGRRRGPPPSPERQRRDRDIAAARSRGETFQAIAGRYGITAERVRQIVEAQRCRCARTG
jgi:hypothetical protein